MGLFRRRKNDWIRASAHVVSVNRPPHNAGSTNLRAQLMVHAPGVEAYATEYKELVVRMSKFPNPGTVLPVRIDPDDRHNLDVLWGEVPSNRDLARQQAEQMAEVMRSQAQAQGSDGRWSGPVGSPPPGPPQVTVLASNADGDPVERLEKLATLHASGIIDDEQLAALRAQVLGQAGLD